MPMWPFGGPHLISRVPNLTRISFRVYNPPEVDRIWLWVYFKKIPIYSGILSTWWTIGLGFFMIFSYWVCASTLPKNFKDIGLKSCLQAVLACDTWDPLPLGKVESRNRWNEARLRGFGPSTFFPECCQGTMVDQASFTSWGRCLPLR